MKMTKEAFKELYYNNGTRAVAKMLGVSVPTVCEVAKRYGITLKKPGRRIKATSCKIVLTDEEGNNLRREDEKVGGTI